MEYKMFKTETLQDQVKTIKKLANKPFVLKEPEKMSQSELIDYALKLLFNRMVKSKKVLLLLINKKHFYEAFLVSGFILETCSVFSYIKDSKPNIKNKRGLKYACKCIVSGLLELLETETLLDGLGHNTENTNDGFNNRLEVLKNFGDCIIDRQNKKLYSEKSNSEIIAILKNKSISKEIKKQILKSYYKKHIVSHYINGFDANFQKILDKSKITIKENTSIFPTVYAQYCSFKHVNLFNNALDGVIASGQFIYPMIWVFAYLEKFKLDPIGYKE
jgi:hypothetical protein